jgi:Epoxide hydrolase N terminus
MAEVPFTIGFLPAILEDLASRLSAARFAPRVGRGRWDGGADPEYLRELVTYWAEEFSWQHQQDHLNSYDHAILDVDGTPIHVVRVAAQNRAGADPTPTLQPPSAPPLPRPRGASQHYRPAGPSSYSS